MFPSYVLARDSFKYFPLQNYLEADWGGPIRILGEWAYFRE